MTMPAIAMADSHKQKQKTKGLKFIAYLRNAR